MPNFIPNFFNWACPDGKPPSPVGSPMKYVQHTYGVKGPTIAHVPDIFLPLNDEQMKRIQRIVGALLYYAIAQDNTYLPAVCDIAREQKHATERTLEKVDRLLAYAAKYPNNILEYKKSDMILRVYSDGSYQSPATAPTNPSPTAGAWQGRSSFAAITTRQTSSTAPLTQ